MEAYPLSNGSLRYLQWRAPSAGFVSILDELGHELRRPEAKYLRGGIYELRTKHAGVNYRMLYFFPGRTAAVVSHGIMKQQAKVPPKDIERAVQRKALFGANPQRHTFVPPED